MNNWKIYCPKFQYEKILDDWNTPWAGHKSFAYDLIRNLKPNRIVELGTYRGTSLFSMAQALKDESMKSKITAIDTWEGDEHSGFYDNDIYEGVLKIKNTYYKNVNIQLLRTTFDNALKQFPDKSIDLLHIDGLHTYKAVKRDLENWFPKVQQNGIIMFHDTHEKMNDFGVYKLWEELKKKYAYLDFSHSHGLGIILLNNSSDLHTICQNNLLTQHYELLYAINNRIRREINNKSIIINQLNSQLCKSKDKIHKLEYGLNQVNSNYNKIKIKLNSINNSLSWKLTKPLRSLPFKRPR